MVDIIGKSIVEQMQDEIYKIETIKQKTIHVGDIGVFNFVLKKENTTKYNIPEQTRFSGFLGLKVFTDKNLPLNAIELRDSDGTVLSCMRVII